MHGMQIKRTERGAGLMLAIFLMATVFTMITTGLILVQISKRSVSEQLTYHGQAMNAAQSGLVDSLAWFRRQTAQPVTSFAPLQDLSATPPVNETDDATVGLVREYEVSGLGSVWGRYEVRASEVVDLSFARGSDTYGTVWSLVSHGVIYVRRDETKAFDEFPNRILARAKATTEIKRLALVPPGNAALMSTEGANITTQANTRVFGGTDIGIGYGPTPSTVPTLDGNVDGSPDESQISPFNSGIPDVFGVSQQELIGMADIVATSVTDLPTTLPAMSLIVISGNANFTTANPLRGSGILVVFGDMSIAADSFSNFNGFIYVTGDYTQRSPSQVSGSILAIGDASIQGTSDFSEVSYDSGILTQLRRQLGQYRWTRNPLFRREVGN